MVEIFIIVISSIYIIYLLYEYRENRKARERLMHVIHVNGTRGKSSVCRLIDAGLRSGGYSVFTKTTGTIPGIIDTKGEEHEIYRRGKPNIKEQIKILKKAVKEEAEILVIECMAVQPQLQYISQNRILMGDIGIVTNVRRDHLLEMGPGLKDVAKALGNVMPSNGVFITADKKFYDYYVKLGEEKNTKVILAKDYGNYGIDFRENVALALEVCNMLGINSQRALKAMKNHKPDPGKFQIQRINSENEKEVIFLNAFAANDPDSTLNIYEEIKEMDFFENKKFVLLINNRDDRVNRMEQFIKFTRHINYDSIWIMGSFTKLMKKRLIENGACERDIEIYKNWREINFKDIYEDSIVFAIGNFNGFGKEMSRFIEGVGEGFAG